MTTELEVVKEKSLVEKALTRYRRVPLAGSLGQAERINQCEREGGKGHILQFRNGGISCLNCPAEWKDEGF
jgi:hypothetical protein